MSSRVLYEFICDECACVLTFVHLEANQTGAVARIDIAASLVRHGWTIRKPEGAAILALNFCRECTEARKAPK